MKIMKPVLIVLVLLCGSISAEGQKSDSKKHIKSIIVLNEKHDMLVTKTFKDSEVYYDPNGNIIEEINYKQGKITKHFKYQYDSDDNKIHEEEYDSAGRLIEYSDYKIENGLRMEKIVYDSNKKMKSRKIYQYTTY
jgi:antitoxin component YwqK of YwqJK toxin-antitoxin module